MTATVFVGADELARLIADHPTKLRVIEVRRDSGDDPVTHLDGAVVAYLITDLSREGTAPTEGKRPLPEVPTLQATLRRWGVDDDSTVVVYDVDGSFVAARAWWVLRWAGLRDVRILDGGLPAWVASGHPGGETAADVSPGRVTVTGGHLEQLDAEGAATLAAEGRLIDARSADAYAAGHIPGARNVGSGETVSADGSLRDTAALRRLYQFDGDPPGLYCGGGVAAAHGVAVLTHLGVQAPLFVGSFSAWSADPNRPVATATPAGGTS
ncbi:sulfurtransferase [Mycolicibacterium sp. GCM10028919]|uniref:sulfurtransferase n=1 Tax=Mycolicibacterium sp. GCM10028919 TaxID=3273401 RepID=UPI00361880FE